jgi:hypothetical protein
VSLEPLGAWHMRWTQLRKQLHERLAPSLASRLDFHVARYRRAHDDLGRAWITLDGVEVLEFSDIKFEAEYYALANDIREQNSATSFQDPAQKAEYYLAYEAARQITSAKANFARWDFTLAARKFLQTSIEDALMSEEPLLRALAVLDRRVGKSRLLELAKQKHENPLVTEILRLRCKAEHLQTTE